jgi:hypothetical protein
MRSIEFSYWLQGWFELDPVFDRSEYFEEPELNRWALTVSKHLEMVFEIESNPSAFCQWMRGFLDAGPVTEENMRRVATRLSLEFSNVIDPTYPAAKQETLATIHDKPLSAVDIPPLKPDQVAYIAEAIAKPPVNMATVIGGPGATSLQERVSDDTYKVVQWKLPRYLLAEVEQRALDRKQGVDQTVRYLLDGALHPDGRPRC